MESLAGLMDTIETTSVKTVFESVIVILALVRVRIKGEDACSAPIRTFTYQQYGQDEAHKGSSLELAKGCIRARHALKGASAGRDLDDSSGPSRKQIKDLERCVDPPQPSILTITNDIRVIAVSSPSASARTVPMICEGTTLGTPRKVLSWGGRRCGRC